MDGRLAGGISQLTLLASTRAWVCPTLADQPILGAVGRAAGPWGRWEALACLAGPPVKGGGDQAAGGASEDPGLTLVSPHPANYSNSRRWHRPLPRCHGSHIAALPQSGEEVPSALGFGDRKQAL